MVDIADIKYYGRAYQEQSEYGFGKHVTRIQTKHDWWFFRETEEFVMKEDLFEGGIIQTRDDEDKLRDLGYIKVFQVDVVALQKSFISKVNIKEIHQYFKDISDARFDYVFRVYFETREALNWEWYHYEQKILEQEAIKWCLENDIEFIVTKKTIR